jgi:hypothetical protein
MARREAQIEKVRTRGQARGMECHLVSVKEEHYLALSHIEPICPARYGERFAVTTA